MIRITGTITHHASRTTQYDALQSNDCQQQATQDWVRRPLGAAPKGAQMLRGLTTVSFWAADLTAAKQWYSDLLGIQPYFERLGPDGSLAYIEFRLGDYQHELGIIDSRYAPAGWTAGVTGAIVYWHVDEIAATFAKLLTHGAKEHMGMTKRGEGFITASVIDPFGNILGIMYNAHYLAILNASHPA